MRKYVVNLAGQLIYFLYILLSFKAFEWRFSEDFPRAIWRRYLTWEQEEESPTRYLPMYVGLFP